MCHYPALPHCMSIKHHILWVIARHLWMLQPQRDHSGILWGGRFTVGSVIRPATLTLLSKIPTNCQLSSLHTLGDSISSVHWCHSNLIVQTYLFLSRMYPCCKPLSTSLSSVAETQAVRIESSNQHIYKLQTSHYRISYFIEVVIRILEEKH